MTKRPSSMTPSPPDPHYEQLRARWHATKGVNEVEHARVNNELSAYVWERAKRQVEADRKAHPKAKRNAPVPVRTPEPYEGL